MPRNAHVKHRIVSSVIATAIMGVTSLVSVSRAESPLGASTANSSVVVVASSSSAMASSATASASAPSVVASAANGFGGPTAKPAFSNDAEAAIVRAIETLRSGGIKAALVELDGILAKNPNFRLAHLIRGDLLMAKSGAPTALSAPGLVRQGEAAINLANLRHEAQVRLTRYFDGPSADALPTALLQMAPDQEYALLVDTSKSRLYVFRNVGGRPQYVIDFYTTIGKRGMEKEREGDQKTPIGVYHVTSSVAKEKLTDFYGPGAFPINFPNDIDKKLGRTGSGIWIHGTPPDTYSRPPLASDGCVVLTNDDFAKLNGFVKPGVTPVIIAPSLEWQSPAEWSEFRGAFDRYLDTWRRDWESLNMDRYLAHYSKAFDADGQDLAEWSARKRRVNAPKTFVKVDISNISVFEYNVATNQAPMMMVTFDQDYKSSNNATKMKKRQYWTREDGRWKIVFEGSAG
jgi:murein L,D-transpeptidase YafK